MRKSGFILLALVGAAALTACQQAYVELPYQDGGPEAEPLLDASNDQTTVSEGGADASDAANGDAADASDAGDATSDAGDASTVSDAGDAGDAVPGDAGDGSAEDATD
jgi:hypothetical protein